ncbi:MAG: FISUMP domain-containing protein [Candidatus Cryptobacteroides sp.]
MKKEILMLAALLMSAACEMTIIPDHESAGERITLYFTGEKPATASDTKTYYDPVSDAILWSASGEYMMVAMSNSAETEGERYDENVQVPKRALNGILQSNEAVVSADGKTAKFSLTENAEYGITFPSGEGKYRFHSVYPASASCGLGNYSIWDWLIFVGTRPDYSGQYPSATSYDPNADVMLGISQQEYTEVTSGMEIPMVFDRLVTHGKITLTGIPAAMTNITKAVITAPEGCTMAGIYYINVLGKEFGGDDKLNQNYVVLNYTSGEAEKEVKSAALPGEVVDGTFDLWFCTQPIEIAEGQPLTISLQNESGCVSRQITAREGGIKFEKNKLSTLTISMADAVFTPYEYELAMTSDGDPVGYLELPRTAGVTEFYIRTNAGNDVSFDYSSFPNLMSVYYDWENITIDSRGWNVFKCYAVHKENHSRTIKIEGTIGIDVTSEGTSVLGSSISILQSDGDGEVVIGDWTGDPVEMAGLLWYPCNLGFDLDHPFGKYYQWGRRAGQYPYYEDNTTKFAYSEYDDAGAIKAVDDNTYYAASNNWFKYDDPETDSPTVDFNWPETDDSPYLGMGNPCPEGWRVPTTAEWKALSKLISSYGCRSTVGLKDKLHGVASFEGKTSSGKAAVWDLWDEQTGAALEFCVAGSITCAYFNDEEYFKNMNNAALSRYDSDSASGQYWASDTTEDQYYEGYRNYSYMDFTAYNITGENTSYKKNEAVVRTIDGDSYPGYSVRCVKSVE